MARSYPEVGAETEIPAGVRLVQTPDEAVPFQALPWPPQSPGHRPVPIHLVGVYQGAVRVECATHPTAGVGHHHDS